MAGGGRERKGKSYAAGLECGFLECIYIYIIDLTPSCLGDYSTFLSWHKPQGISCSGSAGS